MKNKSHSETWRLENREIFLVHTIFFLLEVTNTPLIECSRTLAYTPITCFLSLQDLVTSAPFFPSLSPLSALFHRCTFFATPSATVSRRTAKIALIAPPLVLILVHYTVCMLWTVPFLADRPPFLLYRRR